MLLGPPLKSLKATPMPANQESTMNATQAQVPSQPAQSRASSPPESMRAILHEHYGSAEVLRLGQIERPTISDDGVLVKVHAAGLDRGVWHLMAGLPLLIRALGFGLRAPKFKVPGMDVSGRVEALGKHVTEFQVGDEVFGICQGSFAEYAAVHKDKLALKPANLSMQQAAVVPISAGTALQGLRDVAQLKSGQSVLITGASGGVGTFAVQIAKQLGAQVTGVCSAAKLDLVRSLGADHVIDYKRENFTQLGQRYDVIFDIAGNSPLSDLRGALTPKGTLVIAGGEEGGRWFGGIDRQLRGMLLSPFIGQSLRSFVAKESNAHILDLTPMLESGQLKPVIERSFPLEEARAAMEYLLSGRAKGKLVISVQS
jgi:NADPH:quinone reductase-like Zn-dependent oxidoreductase